MPGRSVWGALIVSLTAMAVAILSFVVSGKSARAASTGEAASADYSIVGDQQTAGAGASASADYSAQVTLVVGGCAPTGQLGGDYEVANVIDDEEPETTPTPTEAPDPDTGGARVTWWDLY